MNVATSDMWKLYLRMKQTCGGSQFSMIYFDVFMMSHKEGDVL